MKTFRCVSVLALLASVPGCALLRPRPEPYPTGIRFPLVEEAAVVFEGRPLPVVGTDGTRVFVAASSGRLYGIDVSALKVAWTFKAERPFDEPPTLGADLLYACDSGSTLFCLDRDGNLRWRLPLPEKPASAVRESSGRIYLGTEKGRVIALDPADSGSSVWTYEARSPVRTEVVAAGDGVAFGTKDGRVHLLDRAGRLRWSFRMAAAPAAAPAVEGSRLIAGDVSRFLYALDLATGKLEWKVELGGAILAPPLAAPGRLYFPAANGVLYGMNDRSGEILWWQASPAKKIYGLATADGKIVVAAAAPRVSAYDLRTGRPAGQHDSGREVMANPLWLDPRLVVVHFDPKTDQGRLVFLKREVRATLTPGKLSPQPEGEEIPFTADAVGFFNPTYEFYVKSGESRTVLQKPSTRKTWSWFPEKAGAYAIGVKVVDEKTSAEAEFPFVVDKKPEQAAGPVPEKK
jgi:outer membrane protein assembly factor BamB